MHALYRLVFLVVVFTPSRFVLGQQNSSKPPLTVEEARAKHNQIAAARVVPTKDNEQFAPYWTAEGGWHTELQLRNNLSTGSMIVTPILRTPDGAETSLTPVTLLSGEVQSIDLNKALTAVNSDLLGKANAYGSIALRYNSPSWRNLYASVMIHDTGHPIMYHLDAINQAANYVTGSREGIWWLPTKLTRDYLILTNQSNHSLQGTLWLYDGAGKPWSQPLQLGAKQTQRLSVRQLLEAAGFSGQYGGIKVEMPQGAGSLDTAHILYDEVAGFSATMKMFDYEPKVKLEERDYAEKGLWSTRAPMLALAHPDPVLAFPANTNLQPMLLLRNTTNRQVKANLSFHWRNASRDGRASVPEVTLAPFESRKIDVQELQNKGAIPLDAYWAQVTLTTNTLPDEVMAVAASYDSTLRYGAQTPFSDQLIAHLEGGQWQVDPTHTSLIAAGNGGTKSVKAMLTLFYDQGRKQYRLERTIAADDQWWIDIGQLIRLQALDISGSALPANLTSGAYQLREISDPEQNLLYEGKVVTDKTFGHATYGCMVCCGYNSGNVIKLIEDPTFVDVSSRKYVDAYATNACSGSLDPVTGYFPTWQSFNTSIFNAQSASIIGVGPGSAQIRTTASGLPWGDGVGTRHACPLANPWAEGGGNVIRVSVTQADITQDNITVVLEGPPGAAGTLKVEIDGPNATQVVQNSGPVYPGTYTYNFGLSNIPYSEFTAVKATWQPDGADHVGSLPYHFSVLGIYEHTQYNTPSENQCSGGPTPITAWTAGPPSCPHIDTTVISGFDFRVTNPAGGTGSGHSINYGDVGQEFSCSKNSGDLRSNVTITGTLGGLSNTTVAACPTGPLYSAGTQVFIKGIGVKTVTDRCPACCSSNHLDNYTTDTRCTGVGSLPNALTVRLY